MLAEPPLCKHISTCTYAASLAVPAELVTLSAGRFASAAAAVAVTAAVGYVGYGNPACRHCYCMTPLTSCLALLWWAVAAGAAGKTEPAAHADDDAAAAAAAAGPC